MVFRFGHSKWGTSQEERAIGRREGEGEGRTCNREGRDTVLCRLVGRGPCPKLKLYCVNSLLCEHAKVAEVVNHTIGVYTATTPAWDMDLCQPTCKALYVTGRIYL